MTMNNLHIIRAAAVQISPVLFSREGTIKCAKRSCKRLNLA
jgi:hypothetical protein